jgi:hypothetical protein
MTIWDFIDGNLPVVITLGVVAAIIIVGLISRGTGIRLGALELLSKKYTVEGLMLENKTLRSIVRKIADLEDRTLLRRQMAVVEETVDELVVLENADFRRFLSERKITAPHYDNALHDNDRVMSETRKMLVSSVRVYMRQNGFADMDDAKLKEYVAKRYAALYDKCDQLRYNVSFDEEIVAKDYIAWAATINLKPYKDKIFDCFLRARGIAIEVHNTVRCLQEDHKRIEDHFIKTGQVLPPSIGCELDT